MQTVEARVEFKFSDPYAADGGQSFRYDFRFDLPFQLVSRYRSPNVSDREIMESIRVLSRKAGESVAYSMGSFFCDWMRQQTSARSGRENSELAEKFGFKTPGLPLDEYAHRLSIEILDQLLQKFPMTLTSSLLQELKNTIMSYVFSNPVPLKTYQFDSANSPEGSIQIPSLRSFDLSAL